MVYILYTDNEAAKRINYGYLVSQSVSSAFDVHNFGQRIREVAITESAIETGCCSRLTSTLFYVLQTFKKVILRFKLLLQILIL